MDIRFPYTQVVSYPRSGSTVFTKILRHTFKDEIITHKDLFGETKPFQKENFHRSHNTVLKIYPEVKYIVLYRNPTRSITSYYFKAYRIFTEQTFKNFSEDHANKWLLFTKYWLITKGRKNPPNIFYCYYDELVNQTEKLFHNLGNFLLGEQNSISFIGIDKLKPRNRIVESLDHTNLTEQMLDDIDQRCESRIEELGLKFWRDSE